MWRGSRGATMASARAAEPSATQVVRASGGPVHGDAGVSQQRGTVYGGMGQAFGAGDLTMAVPTQASTENTGSLTGHILAQGWSDIN